jgi:hypothetical protein
MDCDASELMDNIDIYTVNCSEYQRNITLVNSCFCELSGLSETKPHSFSIVLSGFGIDYVYNLLNNLGVSVRFCSVQGGNGHCYPKNEKGVGPNYSSFKSDYYFNVNIKSLLLGCRYKLFRSKKFNLKCKCFFGPIFINTEIEEKYVVSKGVIISTTDGGCTYNRVQYTDYTGNIKMEYFTVAPCMDLSIGVYWLFSQYFSLGFDFGHMFVGKTTLPWEVDNKLDLSCRIHKFVVNFNF